MKRFLNLVLLFAVVGCANLDPNVRREKLAAQYTRYSCPLLQQKYQQLKSEKVSDEKRNRRKDTAKPTTGGLSMTRSSNINYQSQTSAEVLRNERMQIVEQIIAEKNCSDLHLN